MQLNLLFPWKKTDNNFKCINQYPDMFMQMNAFMYVYQSASMFTIICEVVTNSSQSCQSKSEVKTCHKVSKVKHTQGDALFHIRSRQYIHCDSDKLVCLVSGATSPQTNINLV